MDKEIEVGEYIRTFNGEIGKIIKIKDDDEYSYDYYICDDDRATGLKSYIVKHSHNIIDLIEERDYVNGCKVYENHKTYLMVYQKVKNSEVDYNYINHDEIKSILTKEQFNANCYEVKE